VRRLRRADGRDRPALSGLLGGAPAGQLLEQALGAAAAVETIILDALRHNLMQPQLVAEFVRALNEETNRARHSAELQVEARRRELGEVARKLDGLIEAMAEGFRAPWLQAKLGTAVICLG
jgi:hypothetical protein